MTDQKRVCGSFTKVSWDSKEGSRSDPDAFLFSLDNKLKFEVKRPDVAIFCDKDWGPTFGGSNDLSARDSPFNEPDKGHSNSKSRTYFEELPIKVSPLTGTETKFTIVKMEVYKVSK